MPLVQGSLAISMVLLILVNIGIYAVYGPFWALPSLFMIGTSAPRHLGTSAAIGIAAVAAILVAGGLMLLLPFVRKAQALE